MVIRITAVIQKEEDWFVAKCLENNIASQGKTVEQAIENLKEAVHLYYEDGETFEESRQTLVTTLEIAI